MAVKYKFRVSASWQGVEYEYDDPTLYPSYKALQAAMDAAVATADATLGAGFVGKYGQRTVLRVFVDDPVEAA